jgi:hypothetical protein
MPMSRRRRGVPGGRRSDQPVLSRWAASANLYGGILQPGRCGSPTGVGAHFGTDQDQLPATITQAEITSSELGAPPVMPALIGRRRTPRWRKPVSNPWFPHAGATYRLLNAGAVTARGRKMNDLHPETMHRRNVGGYRM